MTGDLLHEGHIKFLQAASGLCDVLIVGLTTDELAKKQKRPTWFSFIHRYATISSLKYVHTVVEHNGQSKSNAYKMLNFNTLFIGDDYIGSEEYTSFQKSHPEVKVFYLPRTSSISSSDIITRFENKVCDKIDVLSYGIGGPLIRMTLDKKRVIVKSILLGYKEYKSYNGSDSYGIACPPPRNWKIGKDVRNKYPMISGVNGYREIKIHEILAEYPWNPYIKTQLVNSNSQPVIADIEMNKIDTMQYERKYPTRTYWLYQRYAGDTLEQYMQTLRSTKNYSECKVEFDSICATVYSQIQVLRNLNIVHGDLHPGNICIDDNRVISFIDFGWCLSNSFEMEDQEREYLQECLDNDFDWCHFKKSLCSFNMNIYDKE